MKVKEPNPYGKFLTSSNQPFSPDQWDLETPKTAPREFNSRTTTPVRAPRNRNVVPIIERPVSPIINPRFDPPRGSSSPSSSSSSSSGNSSEVEPDDAYDSSSSEESVAEGPVRKVARYVGPLLPIISSAVFVVGVGMVAKSFGESSSNNSNRRFEHLDIAQRIEGLGGWDENY